MRITMILALAAGLSTTTAALAATPASYAALDKASAAACRTASQLKSAQVGPVTRFSDRTRQDARIVTGIWPQPHMKGKPATLLCLYDRRTRRAEVQEFAGMPTAPAPAIVIKDRRWRVLELDGRKPLPGSSGVTLMFGSDGHIAAQSGCNGFGGRYVLDGTALSVMGPMIGTMMACGDALMAQERAYQALLAAAKSLVPQPNGGLLLTTHDGRRIVLGAGA